jgi:hypothetical protein
MFRDAALAGRWPTQARFWLEWECFLAQPTHEYTLADALKSLKQGVARRLIGTLPLNPRSGLPRALAEHFWQKRYYDFNIRSYQQSVEKLRYIHWNPVKQGLCNRPEDCQWSSFRHYATGLEGRVEIESEWTARKRCGNTLSSARTAPLKPKPGLNGTPAVITTLSKCFGTPL